MFASPFARTRQTLRGVLSRVPRSQVVKVREDPRLREQEFGNLQTREMQEAIWQGWRDVGKFFYRPAEGESAADCHDRISSFFDTLFRVFDSGPQVGRGTGAWSSGEQQQTDSSCQQDTGVDIEDSSVVIVTHGLTLRVILMRWFHWSKELFEMTTNPKNCAVIVMERKESDGTTTVPGSSSSSAHRAAGCRWFELDKPSLLEVGLTEEVLGKERRSRREAPLHFLGEAPAPSVAHGVLASGSGLAGSGAAGSDVGAGACSSGALDAPRYLLTSAGRPDGDASPVAVAAAGVRGSSSVSRCPSYLYDTGSIECTVPVCSVRFR